jgi:hypothetical protein
MFSRFLTISPINMNFMPFWEINKFKLNYINALACIAGDYLKQNQVMLGLPNP